MKYVYAGIGILVVLILYAAVKSSRFGVDSPAYQVVESEGAFEIREYPSMTLVGTPMAGDDVTQQSSFMRLFRYISGSNEAEQKIAMTTPVLTTEEDGKRQMSFIVPAEVAADGAPRPSTADVELATLSGGRFAVYRFSGGRERRDFEEAEGSLRAWIRERDLDAGGSPILASYDPPFTPPFLRRNEILIRLES